MLKRTERISFRISFVLSKVEPEPGAGPSHRLQPKITGSGSTTLSATGIFFYIRWTQQHELISMCCPWPNCLTTSELRILVGGRTPLENSGGGGRFSKLEYFKYGRAPKLASMDWPDCSNIGCDSPVKTIFCHVLFCDVDPRMFYITYPGSNGLNLVLDIYPEDLYNADPYPGSKQLQKII